MSPAAWSEIADDLVTLVLTSCDRPAFLERTLKSITACDLTGIKRIIVIEDSTNPEIEGIVTKCLQSVPHLFLQNEENIGQIASIDRAYAHIDTPYIFHCEEDWLFPSGLFLAQSLMILENHPKVHAVMVRIPGENPDNYYTKPKHTLNDVSYWITDPKIHRRWGSFSFNPGLRRTNDYTNITSYMDIGPERDISLHFKLQGYSLAVLENGDVTHFGYERTVKLDETKRKRALGYFFKSFKHRIQFLVYKHFK
ncbi:MAG: glycosyltransferase family 2 protein [Amylibacter sp.]